MAMGVADPDIALGQVNCPAETPIVPQISQSQTQTAVSGSRIYLDVSGSMAGFVSQPPQNQRRRFATEVAIYPDMVRGLPGILARQGGTVGVRPFGSEIGSEGGPDTVNQLVNSDIPESQRNRLYRRLANGSRIDQVLEQVAQAESSSLAVIATDLFLTQNTLYGSGVTPLSIPMATILGSGRSIGVLAVRSRFTKAIDDLPTARPHTGAVARPVFFLIIGPDKAVTTAYGALSAAYLQDPRIESHFAVFSSQQASAVDLSSKMQPEKAVLPHKAFVPKLHRDSQQQSNRLLTQYEVQNLPQIWSAALPTPEKQVGARLAFKTQARGALHPALGAKCTWGNEVAVPNLATLEGATVKVTLQPGHILPGQTYLLRGTIVATEVDESVEPFTWMADWSFDASSEAATIARNPPMFPTLNLLALGRTLAAVVMNDLRTHPNALGGFEFVVTH